MADTETTVEELHRRVVEWETLERKGLKVNDLGILADTETTVEELHRRVVEWETLERKGLKVNDLGILVDTETTVEELHRRVVEWQTLERKGLKVSVKNTEVMVCRREVTVETDTSDKKKDRLKKVDKFKSLSSMISVNGGCEEVRHRVGDGRGK